MDDYYNEYEREEENDYEPTNEEWRDIEDLILQEEMDEMEEYKREKAVALRVFVRWCKENGMIW